MMFSEISVEFSLTMKAFKKLNYYLDEGRAILNKEQVKLRRTTLSVGKDIFASLIAHEYIYT